MTTTMRVSRAVLTVSLSAVLGGAAIWAQEPIGSVSLNDASVVGSLRVSGGRAQMLGGTTLTAGSHTAQMLLARGGSVAVCATSALHVTSGQSPPGAGAVVPLLLALDRGAIEVHMEASPRDAIMTPDMLFAILRPGTLDLRLRVTNSGDTCVENRGGGAPSLAIQSQFGDGSYELHAGQHVLFEHGSLKEVVDHESSPCGCPASAPVVSVADAGVSSSAAARPGARVAAAEHPFPAAESQGLTSGGATSAGAVPASKPGDVHAQVAATLAFDPTAVGPRRDSLSPAPAATAAAPVGLVSSSAVAPGAASGDVQGTRAEAPQQPEATPVSHGFGHRIGRFFKRLFGAG